MIINLKNKIILITGGTGYIGSSLAKRLLALDARPLILSRKTSSNTTSNYKIEYTTDNLQEKLSEIDYDLVFHLASKISTTHCSHEIDDYITANISLGTKVLEDIRLKNKNIPFINISSYWENSVDPSHLTPFNLYAATKISFQAILKYYSNEYKIPSVTLKLFDVYGENDNRRKLLSLILKERELNVSSGEQLIDFTHIDDVLSALIQSIKHTEFSSPKYSVSTMKPMKLRTIFDFFNNHPSRKYKLNIGSKELDSKVIYNPICDNQLPGWEPTVDLFSKLEELINENS